MGLLFLLALATCCSCTGFILGRCWCNKCGGRHGQKQFIPKEKYYVLGGTTACFILLVVGCAIAWSANVKVSQGLDKSFVASDVFIEYGSEYINLATTAVNIANDFLKLEVDFNSTVENNVPTFARLAASEQCILVTLSNLTAKSTAGAQLQQQVGNLSLITPFTNAFLVLANASSVLSTLPSLDPLSSSLGTLSTAQTLNSTKIKAQLDAMDASYNAMPTPFSDLKNNVVDVRSVLKLSTFSFSSFDSNWNRSESAWGMMPNLTSLYNNVSNSPSSTTGAIMLSSLLQLQNALYQFPSFPTWRSITSDFDRTTSILVNAVALTQPISLQGLYNQLSRALQMLPSLDDVASSLALADQLVNMASADNMTQVCAQLKQTHNSHSAWMRMPLTMPTIASEADAADAVANTDLMRTLSSTLSLSSALSNLTCTLSVLSDWKTINSSVVVLPSSSYSDKLQSSLWKVVPAQRARDATFNQSLDAIKALAGLASQCRNKTSLISALQTVTSLNGSFAQYNKSCTELSALSNASHFSMNTSLATVSNLQAAMPRLSAGNMASFNSSLAALRGIVQNLPNVLQYISLISNISSIYDALTATLPYALDDANNPAFSSTGVREPHRSTLLSQLNTLRTLFNSRPSTAALLSSSASLQTARANYDTAADEMVLGIVVLSDRCFSSSSSWISFRTTNLSATVPAQADAARALNATSAMALALSKLQGAMGIMNMSVCMNCSRDMNATITALNITQLVAMGAVVVPLNSTDVSGAVALNSAVRGVRTSIPDLGSRISQTSSQYQYLLDRRDYLVRTRADYYRRRNQLKLDVDNYDGGRIAFFNLLVLLPSMTCLLILPAWLMKRGWPSMCMAIMAWLLTVLLLLACAFALPLAGMFSDHCLGVDSAVKTQTTNKVWQNFTVGGLVNLTRPLELQQYADYFLKCDGLPELLVVLSDPASLLAKNGLNFSDTRLSISSSLPLSESFKWTFDRMDALLSSGVSLISTTRQKMDCAQTRSVYLVVYGAVCEQLAPQLSLSVVMFLLLAICMCPQTVMGVLGYKRLHYLYQEGYLPALGEIEMTSVSRRSSGWRSWFSPLFNASDPEAEKQKALAARAAARERRKSARRSAQKGGVLKAMAEAKSRDKERGERAERGDKGDKGARGDRDKRSERGDRSDRSDRGDRGDRGGRGDRGDRGGDRSHKPSIRHPARQPSVNPPVPALNGDAVIQISNLQADSGRGAKVSPSGHSGSGSRNRAAEQRDTPPQHKEPGSRSAW